MSDDEHLTHGWEPDLPVEDSILRRFLFANADRNAFVAERSGGRSARWDDLAVADPASPVIFDNAGVLLVPPVYTDLDDAVRRFLDFYPPERHAVLISGWPTPDLSGHGLELMGHPPLMLRVPGGEAPPLPEGLTIERVTDARTLTDWVQTLVEAYPMPGGENTVLADPSILDGPLRLFVGYVDGRPVATSGARIGHGITDVEWVSARPEVRRRGIGAAITWAATLAEPSNPAVLIATDDGQPVYEAMGYLRLMRLTVWHRPGAGAR